MCICVHPQTLHDRLRSESIRFFVFFFANFKQWGYALKDRQQKHKDRPTKTVVHTYTQKF